MAPINEVKTLVPLAVLAASVLGSGHCVAMCGGLTFMVGRTPWHMALYHLGRLVAYASLGALAGLFGKKVLGNAFFSWVPWVTSVAMALLLFFLGVSRLFGKPMHFKMPGPVSRVYSALLPNRWVRKSAFGVGVLSAFLPCGWLYSFVLAASVTQSVTLGAFSLALFWLGTVPALSTAPMLVSKIFGPISKAAPKFSGILLIFAGLFTVGVRSIPLFSPAKSKSVVHEQKGSPVQAEECPFHHSQQHGHE